MPTQFPSTLGAGASLGITPEMLELIRKKAVENIALQERLPFEKETSSLPAAPVAEAVRTAAKPFISYPLNPFDIPPIKKAEEAGERVERAIGDITGRWGSEMAYGGNPLTGTAIATAGEMLGGQLRPTSQVLNIGTELALPAIGGALKKVPKPKEQGLLGAMGRVESRLPAEMPLDPNSVTKMQNEILTSLDLGKKQDKLVDFLLHKQKDGAVLRDTVADGMKQGLSKEQLTEKVKGVLSRGEVVEINTPSTVATATKESVPVEAIKAQVPKNPTEMNISGVRNVAPENATPEFFDQLDKHTSTPEAMEYWKGIYAKATPKTAPASIVEMKGGGKVENVFVVKLADNCQRLSWLGKAKESGLVDKAFPDLDCYGSCWTNRKQTPAGIISKRKGFIPMEKRNIALATPKAIDGVFANKKMVKDMNRAVEIRHGQTGDDSHSIATGLAEYWLQKSQAAGIKTPQVFISAAYSPASVEQYAALAKHKNVVIHFTESGWFDRGEILNRFKEFLKAKSAGTNARLRIITNSSGVKPGMDAAERAVQKPLEMPNEEYLMKLVDKYIPQGERGKYILETPYHNDAIKSKAEIKRSEPSIKGAKECCPTGKCMTCPSRCLTKGCK